MWRQIVSPPGDQCTAYGRAWTVLAFNREHRYAEGCEHGAQRKKSLLASNCSHKPST